MRFRPIREFQDRAITWLLGSVEHMSALLEIVVPEIAKDLEDDSLRALESTLISENMGKAEEDVVYEGNLKTNEDSLAFVVLVAHQSTRDPWIPFRFLRAMVRLWEREIRSWDGAGVAKNNQRLRAIVPILIYSGQKAWPMPNLSNLFVGHQLFDPYIPRFEIAMLDLAVVSRDDLLRVKRPLAHLLRLFSAQYMPGDFEEVMREALEGLKELDSKNLSGLVWFCIQFAFNRRPGSEWVKMKELCIGYLSVKESRVMEKTIAESMGDRIRRESREKGLEQGLEQGQLIGQQKLLSAILANQFKGQTAAQILEVVGQVTDMDQLAELAMKVNEFRTWEEFCREINSVE